MSTLRLNLRTGLLIGLLNSMMAPICAAAEYSFAFINSPLSEVAAVVTEKTGQDITLTAAQQQRSIDWSIDALDAEAAIKDLAQHAQAQPQSTPEGWEFVDTATTQPASARMDSYFAVALAPIALQLSTSSSPEAEAGSISLQFRDAQVQDILYGLMRHQGLTLIIDPNVSGSISLNLRDVTPEQALDAIANAAGLSIARHATHWMIRPSPGRALAADGTQLRSFRVRYSDIVRMSDIVSSMLSERGSVNAFAEQRKLVVRDEPQHLERIAETLRAIDQKPQQILIDAQILEISVSDSDSFGLDLTINGDDGDGNSDSASLGSNGMRLQLLSGNVGATLTALRSAGRVKTLSAPRLLVLEDQSARVVVGDRIGYRTTSTVEGVTSEVVEFLESGVILDVRASIDERERILLEVSPEVSSGNIQDGLPRQSTTKVTTQLLANNGQPVLIGGLIRRSRSKSTSSPPLFNTLFGSKQNIASDTETVVIIRPVIVDNDQLADHAHASLQYAPSSLPSASSP